MPSIHNDSIRNISAVKNAYKEDNGKVRMELLPPDALYETAKVFTKALSKYPENNWCSGDGLDWSRVYGALQRHLNAFWNGKDIDEEWELPALAHAACNILMLLSLYLRKQGKDDRMIKRVNNDNNNRMIKEPTKEQIQKIINGAAEISDNVLNDPEYINYSEEDDEIKEEEPVSNIQKYTLKLYVDGKEYKVNLKIMKDGNKEAAQYEIVNIQTNEIIIPETYTEDDLYDEYFIDKIREYNLQKKKQNEKPKINNTTQNKTINNNNDINDNTKKFFSKLIKCITDANINTFENIFKPIKTFIVDGNTQVEIKCNKDKTLYSYVFSNDTSVLNYITKKQLDLDQIRDIIHTKL